MARFKPRSFCEVPDDFGQNPHARFRVVTAPDRRAGITAAERRRRIEEAAAATAAVHQHQAALAIRHILVVRKKTCADYGRMTWPGNARRLRLVLRGDIAIRPEELAQLDLMLSGVNRLMRVSARRAQLEATNAAINAIMREAE